MKPDRCSCGSDEWKPIVGGWKCGDCGKRSYPGVTKHTDGSAVRVEGELIFILGFCFSAARATDLRDRIDAAIADVGGGAT